MRSRALDINHDWTFGKGQNDYKVGNAAVAQNIDTRLNSFLGDCFFNTGAGIDWFNLLGGKDQTALNLSISTTIINTANVARIVALATDLNHNTRVFTITYTVQLVNQQVISGGISIFMPPNRLITEGGDPITTEAGVRIDV